MEGDTLFTALASARDLIDKYEATANDEGRRLVDRLKAQERAVGAREVLRQVRRGMDADAENP